MHHLTTYLIVGILTLIVLAAVAPALSNLAHAAVPLVIALGIVALLLRLVFFHTRRW